MQEEGLDSGRVRPASGGWQHSEMDLEAALDQHITDLLLDLGDDFAFPGRPKRLRIAETWFRIDFLFSIVDSFAWLSSISKWVGSATPMLERYTST